MTSLRICDDCGNLMESVVSATIRQHICSRCNKKAEFVAGDTLIRAPAIKPSGVELSEHILRHMHKIDLMPIRVGKECPACQKKRVRFAILNDITWYKCSYEDCAELFQ